MVSCSGALTGSRQLCLQSIKVSEGAYIVCLAFYLGSTGIRGRSNGHSHNQTPGALMTRPIVNLKSLREKMEFSPAVKRLNIMNMQNQQWKVLK